MNVIAVLWMRQLKRYVRSRARIIGALGQPLLLLVGARFRLGPRLPESGAGQLHPVSGAGRGRDDDPVHVGLFRHRTDLGPAVRFSERDAGRSGFAADDYVRPRAGRRDGGGRSGTDRGRPSAFLAGFRVADWSAIPLALVFMALMALLFTALGTAIASLLSDFQGFQLIMNFLVMPTFFLSGALFPMRDLPWALNILVHINPMSYGVDGLRGALTGIAFFNPALDMAVLAAVAVVLSVLGRIPVFANSV